MLLFSLHPFLSSPCPLFTLSLSLSLSLCLLLVLRAALKGDISKREKRQQLAEIEEFIVDYDSENDEADVDGEGSSGEEGEDDGSGGRKRRAKTLLPEVGGFQRSCVAL
jgi:hypothetical protein